MYLTNADGYLYADQRIPQKLSKTIYLNGSFTVDTYKHFDYIGDSMKVTMADGATYTYSITDITIYESTSEWTLPVSSGKTLVLVTCYPFQYSGHAPRKCVVTGICI